MSKRSRSPEFLNAFMERLRQIVPAANYGDLSRELKCSESTVRGWFEGRSFPEQGPKQSTRAKLATYLQAEHNVDLAHEVRELERRFPRRGFALSIWTTRHTETYRDLVRQLVCEELDERARPFLGKPLDDVVHELVDLSVVCGRVPQRSRIPSAAAFEELAKTAGHTPTDTRRSPSSKFLNDALAGRESFVLLGDGGAGKSTLLRYFSKLLAENGRRPPLHVQRRVALTAPALNGRVPFLVHARDLVSVTRKATRSKPLDWVATALVRRLRSRRIGDLSRALVAAALRLPSSVLLIDGFDEIFDHLERSQLAGLLSSLVGLRAQVIVATREERLHDLQSVEHFFGFARIAPLGEKQQEGLLRLYLGVEDVRVAMATVAAPMGDLAQSPLFLALGATLFRNGTPIGSITEAIRRFSIYLLCEWKRSPDSPPTCTPEEADSCFRRLCSISLALLHPERGVSATEAFAPLRSALDEILVNDEDRRAFELAAKAGIFIPCVDRVAFLHRRFLEAFAAFALATSSNKVRDCVLDSVARRIVFLEGAWEPVLHMLLDVLAKTSSEASRTKANQAVQRILGRSDDPIHSRLRLALRMLRSGGRDVEHEIRSRLTAAEPGTLSPIEQIPELMIESLLKSDPALITELRPHVQETDKESAEIALDLRHVSSATLEGLVVDRSETSAHTRLVIRELVSRVEQGAIQGEYVSDVCNLLCALVGDEAPAVSIAAIEALASICPESLRQRVLESLAQALDKTHPGVQTAIAFALSQLVHVGEIEFLERVVAQAGTGRVRAAACWTIAVRWRGVQRDDRVTRLLERLQADDSRIVKYTAEWALGSSASAPETMLSVLAHGYQDDDETVRRATVRAIGIVGGRRALPLLAKALSDVDVSVRNAAARATYDVLSELQRDGGAREEVGPLHQESSPPGGPQEDGSP